jgi:hypothetical protein
VATERGLHAELMHPARGRAQLDECRIHPLPLGRGSPPAGRRGEGAFRVVISHPLPKGRGLNPHPRLAPHPEQMHRSRGGRVQ